MQAVKQTRYKNGNIVRMCQRRVLRNGGLVIPPSAASAPCILAKPCRALISKKFQNSMDRPPPPPWVDITQNGPQNGHLYAQQVAGLLGVPSCPCRPGRFGRTLFP